MVSIENGTYAVGAYHDENQNGEIDRNALGVPTEVYGFSNNVRGKFGPPGFSDTQFKMEGKAVSLDIHLK